MRHAGRAAVIVRDASRPACEPPATSAGSASQIVATQHTS